MVIFSYYEFKTEPVTEAAAEPEVVTEAATSGEVATESVPANTAASVTVKNRERNSIYPKIEEKFQNMLPTNVAKIENLLVVPS